MGRTAWADGLSGTIQLHPTPSILHVARWRLWEVMGLRTPHGQDSGLEPKSPDLAMGL